MAGNGRRRKSRRLVVVMDEEEGLIRALITVEHR